MSEPASVGSTPRRRPMSMYGTPSPARGLKRLSLVAAREAEDVPSSGGRGLRELALAGSVGSEAGKRGSGSIASIPSWSAATSTSDRRSSVVSTSSATSLPSMPSASSDASSGCPDSPSPSPSSPSPSDSRTTPTRETFSPTPRRHAGARSSISYSPSMSTHTQQSRAQSHATHTQYTTRARTGSTSSTATATSSERDRFSAEIRDRPRFSGDGERVEVLTLAEKHADLLRMIAMRERRVNELRQELATQEQALAALRARWTSVARADSGQTSGPGNALAHAVRAARESVTAGVVAASAGGASASTSASGTTKGSVNGVVGGVGRGARGGAGAETSAGTTANGAGEESSASASGTSSPAPFALAVLDEHRSGETPPRSSQEDEGGLQALLSTLAADADETIQEGKRFWGQLLRTVGAAAGGTVPEDRQERDSVRNSIPGLSSLLPAETKDKDATKAPAPPRNVRIQRPSLSPNAVRRPPTRPLSGLSSSQPVGAGRSASGSSASASTLAASRSRSPQLDFLSDDGDDDHVVTQVLMPVKRMSLHLENGERKQTGAEDAPPSPGSVRSRGSPQPPITAVLDAVGW